MANAQKTAFRGFYQLDILANDTKDIIRGCTGFDAGPARAMGKPNARKCVRRSREKRCRVAKAIRAGFSSGAVLLNSKFHGDVLVLTPARRGQWASRTHVSA